MRQEKTAAVIKPPREFTTQQGARLIAHDVIFEDGEEGTVITSAEGSAEMQAALASLKGRAVEWELDSPREWQGVTKWKIKGFPGKPGSSGGERAGRRWVDQSTSMEAQGAVKQAIAAVGMYHPERQSLADYLATVREMAEGLYRIVQEIKGGQQAQPQPSPPTEDDIEDARERVRERFGTVAAALVEFRRRTGEARNFEDLSLEELRMLSEA